jgi:type IV secretory pathway VirB6-like protein
MKELLLDAAWWLLTAILLSYVVLVTLIAALFAWYDPVYSKMLSASDGLDIWRHNLPIFKQHFGVE